MRRRTTYIALALATTIATAAAGGCAPAPLAVADAEMSVLRVARDAGYENAYVALQDDTLLIRVEDPLPSAASAGVMAGLAAKGHERFPDTGRVVVQLYRSGEPLFALAWTRDALEARASGASSRQDLVDSAELLDLRSPEVAVRSDLEAFPVILNDVTVDDSSVALDLWYQGTTEDDVVADLTAMALVAVEDCPWAMAVDFTFRDASGKQTFAVAVPTTSLIDLADGTIDAETFAAQLTWE